MEDDQARTEKMSKRVSLPKRAVMAVSALISAGLVGVVVVGLSTAAPAAGVPGDPPTVSYASIPDPLPDSVPSVGADNTAYSELGNEVTLAHPGPLASVIATMSVWACESGPYWDNCHTTNPEATFPVPITLTIYSPGTGTAHGPVIATDAGTFNIPFRPSPSPQCAADLPTGFYDATNFTCHNGKAVNITFSNFTFEPGFSAAEPLPATVIYGIAYNTSGHGYVPTNNPPNDPVNYLNIGLSTNVIAGTNASLDNVFMAADEGNLLTCDTLDTGPRPALPPFRSYNVIAPTESSDCGMGVNYYFPAVIINTAPVTTTTTAPTTTTTAPTTTTTTGTGPTTTSPPTTAPPTTSPPTTTPPINPPLLPPFPHAGLSYPNAAIVALGANHYVFAGGRAFLASASELAAVQKVDPAKVVVAEPAGIVPPTMVAPRPGVTVFTQPVNGNVTIYVIGADGELHPFATPTQFLQDGYNGANVITVPNLGAASTVRLERRQDVLTALVTRADGAIVNSSGTIYTFAGGRAFGIPTPAALVEIRKSNSSVELQGSVPPADTGAPMADGVVLSVAGPVYVTYVGKVYPFKTTAQLANTGYGGTPAIPAPHTGGLPVVFPYA